MSDPEYTYIHYDKEPYVLYSRSSSSLPLIQTYTSPPPHTICILLLLCDQTLQLPRPPHIANPLLLAQVIQSVSHNIVYLSCSFSTKEFAFHGSQIRDASADEHGVAFEDHYVPEAGCIVQTEGFGEEGCEDIFEVNVVVEVQLRGCEVCV